MKKDDNKKHSFSWYIGIMLSDIIRENLTTHLNPGHNTFQLGTLWLNEECRISCNPGIFRQSGGAPIDLNLQPPLLPSARLGWNRRRWNLRIGWSQVHWSSCQWGIQCRASWTVTKSTLWYLHSTLECKCASGQVLTWAVLPLHMNRCFGWLGGNLR